MLAVIVDTIGREKTSRTDVSRWYAAVVLLVLSVAALPAEDADEEKGVWQRFVDWRQERIEKTDSYSLAVQGPSYAALQDTRMTPLIYRAVGGGLLFEGRTYRPEELVLTRFWFQFAYVLSDGAREGEFSYFNPRGSGSTSYLRRLDSLPLAVGGFVDLTGNWRILQPMGNSSLNFDVIASVGPEVRWEQSMTLFDRPARWHVGMSVPAVAYVIRSPAYALSYQEPASFWAAPWVFYRLRLSAGIDRLLNHSEENRLAIDYHYDFYGLQEPSHSLTMGFHTITIGYALKSK
jgi:hypothetical protein